MSIRLFTQLFNFKDQRKKEKCEKGYLTLNIYNPATKGIILWF